MKPIWNGALSFGIINIPVRLYGAAKERLLNFKLLDKNDLCPVGYVKICKNDGRNISKEDIVKGYEIEKGQFVIMNDEDFKNADPKKTGSIEIESFVPKEEIGPQYYDKPYFLEPEEKAGKAYALIRQAIKESGLVGIARYVLKEREHIGVVTVLGKALMLIQLRFQNEFIKADDLDFAQSARYTEKELKMAVSFIRELAESFDPSKFKDSYSETLLKAIKQKAKGKKIVAPAQKPITPEDYSNMVELLKRSLERERGKEKVAKNR